MHFIASKIPYYQRLDPHLQEVIIGTGETLVLRVIAAGLTFLFNVLIARWMGADQAGTIFLALTITTIAGLVGRVGLDNTLIRFAAASAASDDWDGLADLQRKGLWLTTAASSLVSVMLILSAGWVSNTLFGDPMLTVPLQVMSLGILPSNLLMLYSVLLRGLKHIRNSTLVQAVGVPLLSIILLSFPIARENVTAVCLAYVLAASLTTLYGAIAWRYAAPQIHGRRGHFDTQTMLQAALPLLAVALMQTINSMAGNLLLGLWAGSAEVAIFNAANRTALLTSVILIGINSIVGPKYAALYHQGKFQTLSQLARAIARLSTLIALPPLLLFVLAPTQVLSLFGSEFTVGAPALMLLAASQFFNVATGSVGLLLAMTGHEKIYRNNVFFTSVANVLLQVVLIPSYGVMGAAIGTSVGLILVNVIAVIQVFQRLSIMTLPIPERLLQRLEHHE